MQGTNIDEDDDPLIEANHFFAADGAPIFLTEEEEYMATLETQKNEDFILANDTVLEEQSNDYQRSYMNALLTQKIYSLRNRDVSFSPIEKIKEIQMKNYS